MSKKDCSSRIWRFNTISIKSTPAMILIQFPWSVSSTSVCIVIASFLVVTDQEITPLKFGMHYFCNMKLNNRWPRVHALFIQYWTICFRFQSMLRVLKRYQFGYHHTSDANSDPVPGQIITFSSYPGVIHSQDDFYLVVGQPEFGKKKHQLAVLGTAFHSYSRSVASLNQKEQVMTGFALHCMFK